MTTNETKALAILEDCPVGATRDALMARGITPATLDALVRDGRVTTRVATMANPKGLVVTWYNIVKGARK